MFHFDVSTNRTHFSLAHTAHMLTGVASIRRTISSPFAGGWVGRSMCPATGALRGNLTNGLDTPNLGDARMDRFSRFLV